MANLGNRTRKGQVLAHLIANRNVWIDGPDLSNEEVGGSEGLRRLRELIEEGRPIESRRHPNPNRDIWQYRYTWESVVSPLRRDEGGYVHVMEPTVTGYSGPAIPNVSPAGTLHKFETMPSKVDFGAVAICPRCRGKTQRYLYKTFEGKRHKDPTKEKTPCIQCNGWGIIPNKGPIAMTDF